MTTETTRLILSNSYGTYSIEVPESDMSISALWEELIMPVLLAAGYSQQAIDKMFELA